MSPLWIAILVSLVVVVGTYFLVIRLSRNTIKGMNTQLEALAQRLGLSLKRAKAKGLSAFYKAELEGELNGRQFYFCHYTRSQEKSRSYVSEFDWSFEGNVVPKVWIGKENMFSQFKKQWGYQDVLTGDEDFDAIFLIKAEDEDFAKTILQPAIRKEIMTWHRQWRGYLCIEGPKIHYEEMGVLLEKRDTDRMFRLIELGEEIAKTAEKTLNKG